MASPAAPRPEPRGGGNFLTQHSIPGIDLPNWVVIIGVVAAVGIAWYIRNRVSGGQSTSAGATSTTASGLPSQIDPVTGVPYSIEGTINPQTGVPFYYSQGQGQTGGGYTIGSNFGPGNQPPPGPGPGTTCPPGNHWDTSLGGCVPDWYSSTGGGGIPGPGGNPPGSGFTPIFPGTTGGLPPQFQGPGGAPFWWRQANPGASPPTPATGTLPPVTTGGNYTPIAPPPLPQIQTRRI